MRRTTPWFLAVLLLACTDDASHPDVPDANLPDARPTEVVYDLGAEFSFTANPNGPWRYGYTAGTTLAAGEFRLDTVATESGSVTIWHPAAGSGGYYPYVGKSSGSDTAIDATQSWQVAPTQVALEASPSGQYAVVAFVVPHSGRYEIDVRFEGIHIRLSTTDVHVRHNDDELFAADIDGYGGNPDFFAVQGANPRASYLETLQLEADDTVSFAVGFGANHSNANDTTGLVARLRERD